MSLLLSILGILITIFLVIGVHEFGHFIVARLCGIKVLRFSIGFGKSLFHWHDKRGTEYVLAAIPLGGYVKMIDETEESVRPEDLPYAFNRQPIAKRIAVICAGPFANLVFAIFLYWLLFVIGFTTIKPIIGQVTRNSIAAEAGLKPQQEILSIDHASTPSWGRVVIKLFERAGDQGQMIIEARSKQSPPETYTLNLAHWKMNALKPDPLISLGLVPYEPNIPALIETIQPNSPAEQSGLKPGDRILAIDNKPVTDWMVVVNSVAKAPRQTLMFSVERNHHTLKLPVAVGAKHVLFTPETGFLGARPLFNIPPDLLIHQQYGLGIALVKAFEETNDLSRLNFIIFGKLITGKVSLKSLGGPISIFESAGNALNYGIIPFMGFLAFLSISIGIINIFPIPGLDGGHFLFQMIELVMRKPLSERMQVLLVKFGMILLLLLIVQALTNDILRL